MVLRRVLRRRRGTGWSFEGNPGYGVLILVGFLLRVAWDKRVTHFWMEHMRGRDLGFYIIFYGVLGTAFQRRAFFVLFVCHFRICMDWCLGFSLFDLLTKRGRERAGRHSLYSLCFDFE